ncbi:MAG: RDD family protein [Pyrinomonadaceae bacterium]|nr:RDD family protein [Pyrinomonadaceae bacterium]
MNTGLIETEETLIIETPERVPLAFALASIGNRFLAVAVDHFIQYLSLFLAAWLFFWLSGLGPGVTADEIFAGEISKWMLALFLVVASIIFSGYFAFFEWFFNGQTPGKRLFKLRVIREDGRPITIWEAIARNILRIVDSFPGFLVPVYSIGLVTVFLNTRDQRIGDLFAGTVVVRERDDDAPTFDETFTSEIGDSAFKRVQPKCSFEADISGLKESQMEVVEAFLRRRWDLSDRQRLWMAWRVALPIMYRVRPTYDSETFTYEGFLEELLHRFTVKSKRF